MSENNMNGKDFLLGAVVGGVIGAITALLLAPKAGKELRADLSDQYQNVSEKTIRIASDIGEKTQRIASDVSEKTQKLAGEVSEMGQEIAEKAKEVVSTVKNEIKAIKDKKEEADGDASAEVEESS